MRVLFLLLLFTGLAPAQEWSEWHKSAGTAYVEKGSYHLNNASKSRFVSAGTKYSDFEYEGVLRLVSGPEDALYGLMLRNSPGKNKNPGGFYVFGIRNGGYASFWKFEDDKPVVLKGWTRATAVKKGANRLRVKAAGDRFDCYVNGSFLFTVRDSAFSSGLAGFYVSDAMHIAADTVYLNELLPHDRSESGKDFFGKHPVIPEISRVASEYGIKISTSSGGEAWGGTWKKAGDEYLRPYEKLLSYEISKYPRSFIRKLKLKMVLGAEYRYKEQRYNGLSFPWENEMYWDVTVGGTSYNAISWLRRCFHHEIFHIFDEVVGRSYSDPEWAPLNGPGFKYGVGGLEAHKDPDAGKLTLRDDALKGFITAYSKTDMREDKAEAYAHMVSAPGYTAKKAASDPVLRKKMGTLKKMLRDFCPEMDEKFWGSLKDDEKEPGKN